MTQATITLLLKKSKDPLLCESYHPVSLLCCDCKFLAKVLAGRLESVLPKFIHPDQTGFVAGRQISSNMRHVFIVLYQCNNSEPEVFMSLDAQKKTFDRTEYIKVWIRVSLLFLAYHSVCNTINICTNQ